MSDKNFESSSFGPDTSMLDPPHAVEHSVEDQRLSGGDDEIMGLPQVLSQVDRMVKTESSHGGFRS